MSELIFIRHAKTDMGGTFCGHSDPELNELGHAQVLVLLEKLSLWDIDAVYTSDLRRARTTADAIVSAFHVECHQNTALREINFGEWEGLTWNEIEQRDEFYARRWLAEYPYLPAPRGETFTNFERRVLDAIEILTVKARDCNIAVVTHAGVLRTVLRKLQGCSEREAWEQTKSYCCIIRYTNTGSSYMQDHEGNP